MNVLFFGILFSSELSTFLGGNLGTILHIENNYMDQLIVGETLSQAFPHLRVVAPNSWEDTLTEIAKLSHGDIVVTDGDLWGSWTASDVFAALALRGMTRRVVLYSSNPDHFPEFRAFASKPQLGELVELVRGIVS